MLFCPHCCNALSKSQASEEKVYAMKLARDMGLPPRTRPIFAHLYFMSGDYTEFNIIRDLFFMVDDGDQAIFSSISILKNKLEGTKWLVEGSKKDGYRLQERGQE